MNTLSSRSLVLIQLWIGMILLGLSLSPFLMSVGSIALLLQWIIECSAKKIKPWVMLTYPGARIFPLIFLLTCIGLLWTSDYGFGFKDIRIKLPLLIIPIALSSYLVQISKPIRLRLENIFILGVLLSTLTSIALYHHWIPLLNQAFQNKIQNQDVREYCVFTSHIRMGLFVALSICMIWSRKKNFKFQQGFTFLLSIYLLYFLILIESFTGILAIGLGALFFLIRFSKLKLNPKQRWFLWPSLSLLSLLLIGYILYAYHNYQTIADSIDLPLPEKTINGHPYDHNLKNRQIENGHYVFQFICWEELQNQWNQRSEIEFNLQDKSGSAFQQTLIRYLAPKGLTKDSLGMMALSDNDIQNIESGIPNFLYPEMNGISRRLDRFFFEFQMMQLGYPPNGHSLFQRFIYWKNALHIIQEHWFLGVGTGDVLSAFNEQYQKQNDGLNSHYQLRTHNQYLTLILTFGFFAWLFIPYMIYTLIKSAKRYSLIALIFTLILLLSFLSEDTLETQAGVTFAAFFSAWWLGAPLWTSEKWRPS
jgi:hypothetical protein